MTRADGIRRATLLLTGLVLAGFCLASLRADETASDRKKLREPVYRITRSTKSTETPPKEPKAELAANAKDHPLDPALKMAREALAKIHSSVRDYTCTLIKQERVNGKLMGPSYMDAKIRNRQMQEDRILVPFSVYLKYRKPASVKGREVIYVEQQNDGKMVAHEGGLRGRVLPTVWLRPDSSVAMRGNRYPITEVGIETLTRRLIEKGERDRKHGKCKVEFFRNATINGRSCTCLQVQHPVRQPYFDFHIARVFMDNETGIPMRYEAYDWPAVEGGQPQLTEAYTYLNLKLNVGLTDSDFDHENSAYNF